MVCVQRVLGRGAPDHSPDPVPLHVVPPTPGGGCTGSCPTLLQTGPSTWVPVQQQRSNHLVSELTECIGGITLV